MATWEKIITTNQVSSNSSLGTSNDYVPTQNAVKSYVDNKDIHVFQFSGRQYIYGSATSGNMFYGQQVWSYPNAAYSFGYYNWTGKQTTNNNTGPSSYQQRFHPQFVVPFDGKVVNHQYQFVASASETIRYELKTGTPSFGSTGSVTLSDIGSGMTQNATSLRPYRFTEDVDISVSEGDILIPTFSKTTNLTDTSLRYCYGTWVVQIQKD